MTLTQPQYILHTYPSLAAFRAAIEAAPDARSIPLAMDGGCPCFHAEAEDVDFDGHCWRTCMDCDRAGFHVTGNVTEEARDVARLLMEKLDAMDWYGEWTLSFEEQN